MKITGLINEVVKNKNSAFFYTPKIYKDGKSILFKKPVESIIASNKAELVLQLETANSLLQKGLIGYGLISYEAGYLFEERLEHLLDKDLHQPLLQFHFFEKDQMQYFATDEIEYGGLKEIITSKGYSINNFRLNTSQDEYEKNIEQIRQYIKEGDTYQVNYTVKGKFDFSGNIERLFLHLIFNQSARYSALINNGDNFTISISPEMFFSVDGDKITAKPMKGTIKRGFNLEHDKEQIAALSKSAKDRAENVMILDLLRNDLGRISEFNSVKPLNEFKIEKYESLFQMTSTVESQLKSQNFAEIIKNIFPCGSITGAPKIRTMEIIHELEKEPRGIYTGAIGLLSKENYKFNVPIRTIKIDKDGKGEIGIGSGVVWDSKPTEEYKETLLKSNFLIKPEEYFELFESILIENGESFLLKEHLNRLKESAEYFLFNFDYEKVRNEILSIAESCGATKKYKLRITLSKWGEVKTEKQEVKSNVENVKVIVSANRINSNDKFQYFKTTNRKLYSVEFKKYSEQGYFEVLYLNERDEIAEGSFTNIFLKINGEWFTPPIYAGVLNGCFRQHILNGCHRSNEINIINPKEKVLICEDLRKAEQIILTNSVRKEIKVTQVLYRDEENIKNLKQFLT